MKCSIQNTGSEITDPEVHILRNLGQQGVSHDPRGLCTGQNGGYQAVNLAVLAGARKIVLLGYDMQYGPEGRTHWHKGHPLAIPEAWYSKTYASHFRAFADLPGLTVVNASRSTRLTCFPHQTIEEALQ